MFGTYRWLLAHMVALGHLWGGPWFGVGSFAVFSFFVLSGYLMALVLDRTYELSPRGLGRYLGNRALRIYPPYWAILAVASLLIALHPSLARSVSTMRLPDDAIGWLQNVLILGIHFDREASAIVPPIWSVDLELWFYLAMGLLLARHRAIIAVWFAASVALTAFLVLDERGFNDRYATLAAASLPYSAGALLHALRAPLGRLLASPWHRPVSLLLYFGNALVARWYWRDLFTDGFYASLVATAYVVAVFAPLSAREAPPWLARVDRWLGDLSYPVFLGHWSAALVVLSLGGASGKGAALFLWTLPLANAFALAVHVGVERPIERLRTTLRGGARPARP